MENMLQDVYNLPRSDLSVKRKHRKQTVLALSYVKEVLCTAMRIGSFCVRKYSFD